MPALTPRLSKRALFDALGYTPHRGQVLVHKSTARRRTLACGTRWGKSKCASMEAMAALMEPRERALIWLVAPTYDLVQRIMQPVVLAMHTKLAHHVHKYDPRQQRLWVINIAGGISELRGKSADQPVSLLGEAVDMLILDEAAKLRREVWTEYLSPRLLDRKGSSLLISTPQGNGWFAEEFLRGQRNRDPDCESWALPTSSNPHVSAEDIEAERKRLPPDVFAQQYEAQFIGVPLGPCIECGGPRTDVPSMLLAPVGADDDTFVAKCPACGMFVGADGQCIVKKHNGWFAELIIDRPWAANPEMTMYAWHATNGDGQTWS
jgi:hypothetical protein